MFVLLGELGALLSLPDWALGLSPFDHLGSLPGGDANAAGLVALVLVALAVGGAGLHDLPPPRPRHLSPGRSLLLAEVADQRRVQPRAEPRKFC